MPSEEVNSSASIQHAKDGRNLDKEIAQMKEEILSFGETMRNYMPKNARP